MSNQVVKEKQAEFINYKYEDFIKERKALSLMREKFVRKFNKTKFKDLPIDNYVIGKGATFCKIIESDLEGLGSMKGSPASKFGIYYGKEKPDTSLRYRFKPKWGTNYQDAYIKVINSIMTLLDDGFSENIQGIINNPLSSMFKGKILSVYYPDRFLSIFSKEHLNHFLKVFNCDTTENVNSDPVLKREALLEFKESDSVFRDWGIGMFSYFLYNVYPLKPAKEEDSEFLDSVKEFLPLKFVIAPIGNNIKMEIKSLLESDTIKKSRISIKPNDYIEKSRRDSEVGSRGEKVVMDYEIRKLEKEGMGTLAQLVRQVSNESDAYGYDILSFNSNDQMEKYIEVKTTTGKPGETIFYISDNELRKAKSLDNYWIYIVYDIQSKNPQVWEVGNLFKPENPDIKVEATNFRVTINASKL